MRATLMGLGFAGVLSFVCYQSAEAVPADGASTKRAVAAASTLQEAQFYARPTQHGGNSLWGVRSAAPKSINSDIRQSTAREFAMSRMSRRLLILALAVLASFARVGSMAAQELGTPDEAKAMLDRAIVALKSDERGALSKFNDPSDQQFHDRDLYIFCFDVSDGKITADSSNGLRGIDIRALKLKDDPMGQRAYDIAQSAPQESVRTMDYSFPKPGTTEPAAKQFLETRVDNQGCGVAYYQ